MWITFYFAVYKWIIHCEWPVDNQFYRFFAKNIHCGQSKTYPFVHSHLFTNIFKALSLET